MTTYPEMLEAERQRRAKARSAPESHPDDGPGDLARWVAACGYHDDDRLALCIKYPGGAAQTTWGTPAELLARDLPGDADTWWSVNAFRTGVTSRTSANVSRVVALVADLDVGGHGKHLRDLQTAHAVIDEVSGLLAAQPAAVVASGHGLQPRWRLDDGGDVARARALVRAAGRLVAGVAERHGGEVDTVSDLARIFRVPTTTNVKDAGNPVRVDLLHAAEPDEADVLSLDDLEDRLTAAGVRVVAEDHDAGGEVVSAPREWPKGLNEPCRYVASMTAGWANDLPAGRHPWLFSQLIRLAAARRYGCLNDATHAEAVGALVKRFRWLLEHHGQPRPVGLGELAGAARDAMRKVSQMTDDEVAAELGKHAHGPDPDDEALVAKLMADSTPTVPAADVAAGADHGDREPERRRPWVDVAAYLDGDHEPVAARWGLRDDGAATFPPASLNMVFGDSEALKTWLLILVVSQALQAGGRVLYVETDGGGTSVIDRLIRLGCPPGLARDEDRLRFIVMESPEDITVMHEYAADGEFVPDLVAVDVVGEVVPALGLSSSQPDDWRKMNRVMFAPFVRLGSCVIYADHTPKDVETAAAGASGTAAKKQSVSGVSLRAYAVTKAAKGSGGRARLTVHKDRHSVLSASAPPRDGGRERVWGDLVLTDEPDGTVKVELLAPDGAAVLGGLLTGDEHTRRRRSVAAWLAERVHSWHEVAAITEGVSGKGPSDPEWAREVRKTRDDLRVLFSEEQVVAYLDGTAYRGNDDKPKGWEAKKKLWADPAILPALLADDERDDERDEAP